MRTFAIRRRRSFTPVTKRKVFARRAKASAYSPFDSEKIKAKKALWFETYRKVMINLSPMLTVKLAQISSKNKKITGVNIVGPTLKALDRLAVEIANTIESHR